MVHPFRTASIFFVLFCYSSILHATTYSEYWQEASFINWERGPFQFMSYAKMDTGNHFKKIRFYQVSEQFAYQASQDLALRFNYRYLSGREIVRGSPWRWQQRFEIEVNPVFHPSKHSLLRLRNRLEFRKFEKDPKIRYRFRQQAVLAFPAHFLKGLQAFSLSNEIFYNISKGRVDQDRMCPCIFTFKLNEKVDLDLYLLVRLFLHEERWRRSFILGSYLRF